MSTIPVSAVIVSRNEGSLLAECLASVLFCEEIIVFDLESTDNTAAIAAHYGARLIRHTVVPIVEEIRVEAVDICKHQWLLFLDPDESLTPPLQAFIMSTFDWAVENRYTAFQLPWIFYYRSHRLEGGIWGGVKYKRCLLNRAEYRFTGEIHTDTTPVTTEKTVVVPDEQHSYIHHKWMRSSDDLFEKHKRYILKEAKQLAAGSRRYSLSLHVKVVIWSVYDYLILKKGYRDGRIGIYLAWFWAWYKSNIWKTYRQLTA